MTTQNIVQERYTFANAAAGTYYYPNATGTDLDGFDNLEVRARLISGDANNTLTLTVEADDGTTGTFEWDETIGMRNWLTNLHAANYVATNQTTRCRLEAINHNAKRWRVRVAVAWAVGANHSGVVEIRKVKK